MKCHKLKNLWRQHLVSKCSMKDGLCVDSQKCQIDSSYHWNEDAPRKLVFKVSSHKFQKIPFRLVRIHQQAYLIDICPNIASKIPHNEKP